MVPTFKPGVTWEGSRDKPGVRTGLGKSDCPGSQGGSGKRGLLRQVRALSFYPDRRIVQTKLAGIAEVAKRRPNEKFTALAHLINVDMLRLCHNEMD